MMRILKNKKTTLFLLLFLLFLALYSLKTIAFLFPNKVYAHRVNSLENLEAAANQFKGVELDVTVSLGPPYFDVNHPPAQSIGLSLENYLQKATEWGITHFWLDVKNLDAKKAFILNKNLPLLFKRLNLKYSNCIIESTSPVHLQKLKSYGFKTSFYLPLLTTRHGTVTYKNRVEAMAKLYPTDYLSTDFKSLKSSQYLLPNHIFLTWYGGSPHYSKKIPSRYQLYKTLLKSNVEVILLPLHTTSGDR